MKNCRYLQTLLKLQRTEIVLIRNVWKSFKYFIVLRHKLSWQIFISNKYKYIHPTQSVFDSVTIQRRHLRSPLCWIFSIKKSFLYIIYSIYKKKKILLFFSWRKFRKYHQYKNKKLYAFTFCLEFYSIKIFFVYRNKWCIRAIFSNHFHLSRNILEFLCELKRMFLCITSGKMYIVCVFEMFKFYKETW